MSAASKVLDRLTRVKQTGAGRWIAPCPAHEDRSPSLSVRETDDGRVLIHCFGGCPTQLVLQAIGLDFGDLFDRPLAHHLPPLRAQLSARELIELTADEVFIAALIIHDSARRKLTAAETDRLWLAAARLGKAQAAISAR